MIPRQVSRDSVLPVPIGRQSTTPQGFTPEGATSVALDPFLFPPRGAEFPNRAGQALNLAPGASADADTFTLGAASQLRIAWIGFGATDPAALLLATWSLLKDGNPLPGFGNLSFAIGTIDDPAFVYIHVPGPATIRLQVTNNDPGSTWSYFSWLSGWIYTQ